MINWRKIPHPVYGMYGGRSNRDPNFLKKPIDQMDYYFMVHDFGLTKANGDKYQRYLVDSQLFQNLKQLELKELSKPIYGRMYWFGSLIIFGLVHYMKKYR